MPEDGTALFTVEAILALVFAIGGWLIKDKFSELARKDLVLTREAFEQAKEISSMRTTIAAQQRQIDRLLNRS